MRAALLAALLALPAAAEEETVSRGVTVTNPPRAAPLSPEGRSAVEEVQRGGDPVRSFERLLGSDPEAAKPWLMAFASALREAGRDPRLRELWTAFARRNPQDPDAFRGLGEGAFAEKDYPSSVAAYTRAIGLGLESPDVYHGRGLAADALGDHELAHRDARSALALDPSDQRAFALAKLTEGRVSSVKLDPASGRPAGAPTAPAVAQHERHESETAPTPAPASDPARTSVVLASDARRRLSLGDPIGALKAALAAAEADPKSAEAHNLAATAYARTNRPAEAVDSASRALALAPKSVPALNTRSWALSGLRRFGEALADARTLLGLDPDNPFGLVAEGRALGGLGRRSEMVDSLSRAAARDPRFAELRGQAVRLPPDQDTELLFGGVGAAPAPAPRKRSRFLALAALTLAGGLLVGLGFLHVVSPRWRERVTNRVREGGAPGSEPLPSAPGIEVRRLVATGGMGMVFEGWDAGLKRKVALKRLRGEIRDDPKERARFLSEARAVAALEHPHIVKIHAVLEDAGEPCLVFEFAEGRTLKDAVAEDGPLSPKAARALAGQLCSALSHAHAQGLVHRDLKPENVMVDARGKAKLMDFGLARPPRAAGSSTTVWGSPPYMAPEAEDGTATAAGDVYALAATLYFAVTGKPPFSGTPGAMSRAKARGEFSRKGLPSGLASLFERGLSPDPNKRFPTSQELLSAWP